MVGLHQFIGQFAIPLLGAACCCFDSMSELDEFRKFLITKGCPGSSRDLTKVLMWLQREDVTCPEDLTHLRKLSHFSGVDKFRVEIIAFIDSLIGAHGCSSTLLMVMHDCGCSDRMAVISESPSASLLQTLPWTWNQNQRRHALRFQRPSSIIRIWKRRFPLPVRRPLLYSWLSS